ncbi:tetratricopeptide repeat protein [Longispora sp. NPDC051575]|uniref:ATP-binding protein n=1 Tax=Longispora sp. NPDC051575 TaxID=3154943 RepID=UPI00344ACC6E
MGALPQSTLPDGPVRTLFDRLHALHHRAGWPSLRDMAREVGCSHTTISVAMSGTRVPRWGLLELIVETLAGDPAEFHTLWLAATRSERSGRRAGDGRPPTVETGGADGAEPPDRAGRPRTGRPRQPDGPDGSPGVAPDDSGRGAPTATVPVPRDLPADVAGFTGRSDQLAALDLLLAASRVGTPTVLVAAVSGTAGVGKTALAVHWAHRVADQFPDGQIYIDLRGYDHDRPVTPAEALAAFLRELGCGDAAVPHTVAERAARYRTLLAGRRVLVVLDNAHSSDQVRDLLPGTPECVVVVTSRDRLPALVARHGAVRVDLDLLTAAEAGTLLRILIGPLVAAEPEQAAALVGSCARLPLALRIAAELAASRPASTLAELVEELSDERDRLDLLAAGDDGHTAVRAVFSWSYRHLDPDAARAFRLLGTHPGGDVDLDAVAALTGVDRAAARRLLDPLARAHLVEPTTGRRFGMHDLLRVYAAELAAAERDEALTRLFDHYLTATRHATAALLPDTGTGSSSGPGVGSASGPPALPGASPDPAATPGPLSPAAARAWLDAELPNLLASAATPGWPAHTLGLAAALSAHLDARSRYPDALTLHALARDAARTGHDRPAEAAALAQLGALHRRLGDYPAALAHLDAARAAYRDLGDRPGEGRALHGAGVVYWRLGRYPQALEHLGEALVRYREAGDRVGEGSVLGNLGIVHRRLGDHPAAIAHYTRSLAVHRAAGDRRREAGVLGNLGIVYLRVGRSSEALDNHLRALEICRDLGYRTGEGIALANVGEAYRFLGRYADAVDHNERALALCREVGYRAGEGNCLHHLGVAHHRAGRPGVALDLLRQAVAVARELGEADLEAAALNDLGTALTSPDSAPGGAGSTAAARDAHAAALALTDRTGDRYERARSLAGLGTLTADPAERRRLRAEALALFEALGVPEAATLRQTTA